MTPGFAALLANQERTRREILAAEGIEMRKRPAARKTQVTAYNAFGWLSNREQRKHPKPFDTDGWKERGR